ncbi:hypothetical protein BDB01DRAFT_849478 [Pilobolus umbonatus]|nr:hypothetical protein BDB01DRAFT_849478 [Pilobolus umbonatus]
MSSSWTSLVTPQEYKYYMQLFHSVSKAQEGIVTGGEAVRFFATSGVPTQILSEIWEAADSDKVGYLTPESFSVALKLIACAQHGQEAVEPILSTVVPFPQFDGTPTVAQSPAIMSTPSIQSNTVNAPITPAECEKYSNIFKIHQPTRGVLDADTAKRVFLKSKLPLDVLSQIWYLADVRQSGSLNQTEFIIAMHYIAKLMDGTLTSLPDKLSPAVYQSAMDGIGHESPLTRNTANMASPQYTSPRHVMTPPQRAKTIDSLGTMAFGNTVQEPPPWDVTPAEKQQYDVYFDTLDTGKLGYIQGKEAVEFFKNSRLPETELAHVWDLSDIQQQGILSRDEFAIAMHLIHKRLNGESLPATLPPSLCPPQRQIPRSPLGQANKPQRSLMDDAYTHNDLLGDFDNDQISNETNQVNLMQNQIQSLSSQTADVSRQKVSAEKALEQLLQQKKDLESQMASARRTYEAEFKSLNELQEIIGKEEVEWTQIKNEYAAAEKQLNAVQNEIARVQQTIHEGRTETENIRRRIVQIQEETQRANNELDSLRAQLKQQNMMLDINRRQVTAVEQDRSEAKRHLEEYKATHFPDQESVNEQENKPNQVDSPSSTRMDNIFGTVTSPSQTNNSNIFDIFGTVSESSVVTDKSDDDFDSIFGTASNSAAPSPFSNPLQSTGSFNAFDAPQWSSPINKSVRAPPPPPPQNRHLRNTSTSSAASSTPSLPTSSTKRARAPPPPPPVYGTPTLSTKEDDAFDAAFSNKLPDEKVVEDDGFEVVFPDRSPGHDVSKNNDFESAFSGKPLEEKALKDDDFEAAFSSKPSDKELNDDDFEAAFSGKPSEKELEEDDFDAAFSGKSTGGKETKDEFEAAFSGKLSEAKVVMKDEEDDDFSNFDDAFKSMDIKSEPPTQKSAVTNDVTQSNAGLGGFEFPEYDAKPTVAKDDDTSMDWDSIFGAAPATSNSETKPDAKRVSNGFDDAFASFSDDFGSSSKASVSSPQKSFSIGLVGDKIQDLVKMGFAEKEAKEALNRYDQDLEKATNYLLDQSK